MKTRLFSRNPTPRNLIYMFSRIKNEQSKEDWRNVKGYPGRPQRPKQLRMF